MVHIIIIDVCTPYHALKEAALKVNQSLLIFGASGSTGMMAVQFGKKMGAKVIAVSKDDWVKDFGADYIISEYDKVVEKVNELTQGKMADVVLNSLGIQTWENSFASVGANARLVTFGGLTGADVKLNIRKKNIKNRINQNNVNISSLVCLEREVLNYVLGTAIFNYHLLISRYISLVTKMFVKPLWQSDTNLI